MCQVSACNPCLRVKNTNGFINTRRAKIIANFYFCFVFFFYQRTLGGGAAVAAGKLVTVFIKTMCLMINISEVIVFVLFSRSLSRDRGRQRSLSRDKKCPRSISRSRRQVWVLSYCTWDVGFFYFYKSVFHLPTFCFTVAPGPTTENEDLKRSSVDLATFGEILIFIVLFFFFFLGSSSYILCIASLLD